MNYQVAEDAIYVLISQYSQTQLYIGRWHNLQLLTNDSPQCQDLLNVVN